MHRDTFTLERWLHSMATRIAEGRHDEVRRELDAAVYEMQCQRFREANDVEKWRELVSRSRV